MKQLQPISFPAVLDFQAAGMVFASNEPKAVLAHDLGDCRENLRNAQSVFLKSGKGIHELALSENARVWYYRETGKLKNIFQGKRFVKNKLARQPLPDKM